jgi:heptosyltransferase I
VKILILKPSSLGDVIHALPLLRLLKLHLPESRIYWWLLAELVPLLEHDPDLTGIIPFHRRRWRWPWHWNELLASIRGMRAHHFDWVIDLQGLARSGIFAWLANGQLTVGLDDHREGARGFYDRLVEARDPAAHAVDLYLEVLRALNVPIHWNFTWLQENPAAAQAIRERWRPNGDRWILINPGARWANKRWPLEHFRTLLAKLVQAEPEHRFAILGGAADRELGRALQAVAPERCVDLTGQTSLPELIEWVRVGELMVTNDTGPMHVAAALGKPVVAVFGPTTPSRTGPYGQIDRVLQQSNLPCIPCLKDGCVYAQPLECLRAITPERVFHAVRQRLAAPQTLSQTLS